MNICCLVRITAVHEAKGGMEVHVKTMSEGLVRSGHTVTVISTGHPTGVKHEDRGGVSIYYCNDTAPGQYSEAWGQSSIRLLKKLHAANPFDIIWGEGGGAYYYLRSNQHKLKIPVVSFIQGSFIGDLRSQFAEIKFNKNLILFFTRSLPKRIYDYLTWDMIFTRKADAVIAPSKECKRDAKLEYFLKKEKITDSINGIDVERFKPFGLKPVDLLEKLKIKKKDFIIFTASRLTREKGIHILIQAFGNLLNTVTNTSLLIAGVGPAKEQLEQQIKRIGIENKVHLLGHIENEYLVNYYNLCDLFVYPTLRYESFGISVAEAMACGCPVVAAKSGGVSTSIDDRVNGFLYKPHKPEQLEALCIRLLTDPRLRERIGRLARNKAERYLSSDKMIKDVLNVFQGITTKAVRKHKNKIIENKTININAEI